MKTTLEQLYHRGAAPWASVFSINLDQRLSSYPSIEFETRTGDSAHSVYLGYNRNTLLALAEAFQRVANSLPEGSEAEWLVRDGVDIPLPESESAECMGSDD